MSETISIEILKERFPSEIVNPYGEVLVIPSRLFQREWESDLEVQGYKVYAGSYNGESTFFVRPHKAEPKSIEKASSSKAEWKRWTLEDVQRLKDLLSQNLPIEEIAKTLDRTTASVERKIQRLGLIQQRFEPTTKTEPNLVVSDEDHIRELLQATLQLFPKFPYACHVLLREATSKLKAI